MRRYRIAFYVLPIVVINTIINSGYVDIVRCVAAGETPCGYPFSIITQAGQLIGFLLSRILPNFTSIDDFVFYSVLMILTMNLITIGLLVVAERLVLKIRNSKS